MRQQRGEPRTVLDHLMRQQQRTYEELAGVFAAVAREAGERATISPRHLARLARAERGSARTTPAVARVLQRMFGQPVQDLLRPWSLDLITVSPVVESPSGSTAVPKEGLLLMAASRARRFSMIASDAGAGPDVVEQLRDDVQRLATLYPQRPVGEVLGDLVEVQDVLFTLLERRQPPATARKLYFLAAVGGGMLAKASHDTGEPHTAMLQARTAVLCADQADHNGLRAWLRGLQSLIAYWAGRHRDALRYAELGADHAAAGTGTTSVWLAASAARAYAALGDVDRAITAIRRAETAWDSVQPDDLDDLGGIATFNQPRALYYAADALAWVPEQPDAQQYAEQAVAAFSDPAAPFWAFGDQAGSHTDLALVHIARREVDGASEALAPVLDLAPERRIAGILGSVHRVHRALARSGAGAAGVGADMQEAIEKFTRTPAAALPR